MELGFREITAEEYYGFNRYGGNIVTRGPYYTILQVIDYNTKAILKTSVNLKEKRFIRRYMIKIEFSIHKRLEGFKSGDFLRGRVKSSGTSIYKTLTLIASFNATSSATRSEERNLTLLKGLRDLCIIRDYNSKETGSSQIGLKRF